MNMEVRIRKIIDNGTPLKALLSVALDGMIAVHDIKLIQRADGTLFAAMPSRKDENNEFRDIVHPIRGDVRKDLEAKIIKAYQYEFELIESGLSF